MREWRVHGWARQRRVLQKIGEGGKGGREGGIERKGKRREGWGEEGWVGGGETLPPLWDHLAIKQ